MVSKSKSHHFCYLSILNFNQLASITTRFLLESIRRWYFRNRLQKYGGTAKSALTAYFLASANIFEPHREAERLAWARTAVLAEAVTSHFRQTGYAVHAAS